MADATERLGKAIKGFLYVSSLIILLAAIYNTPTSAPQLAKILSAERHSTSGNATSDRSYLSSDQYAARSAHNNFSKRLPPNPGYQDYIQRGRELRCMMDSPPDMLPSVTAKYKWAVWSDYGDLPRFGWHKSDLEENKARKVTPLLAEIGRQALPNMMFDMIEWSHRLPTQETVNGVVRKYPATRGFYDNGYSPSVGIIIAEDNVSPAKLEERNVASGQPGLGAGEYLVPLSSWSDVVYLEWAHLATNPVQRRGLVWVMRSIVVNEETKKIVAEACRNTGRKFGPWPGAIFYMDEPDGLAILGSPNGNGVGWLLFQHKDTDQLGWKKVLKVHAYGSGEYRIPTAEDMRLYLAFQVVDHDTPFYEVENDWTIYVRKGNNLVCGMAMTLEQANAFPESAQSKFTSPNQLAEYGWKRTTYSDSEPPVKQALEALGLLAVGHVPFVVLRHTGYSSGTVDGKLVSYPPTGARYVNVYAADFGVIVAADNKGPAYEIMVKEGTDEAILTKPDQKAVPLKQWSDVAFLEWFTATSPTQRKNLRWIFQETVINDRTTQMMFDALVNTKQKLSAWPGAVFYTNQDAGKALLGSPNGNGVGYLLWQHKAELGEKSVLSINIWDENAEEPYMPKSADYMTPNMAFKIVDNPPIFPASEKRKVQRAAAVVKAVSTSVRAKL